MVPAPGKANYERIQDRATFRIMQEENGGYTITCQLDNEKFGWPAPGPVPAIQGLPDESTAESILMRLRQMDIDAHAQYLYQFQPKPAPEQHVEEPTYKNDGRK